MITAVDTNIIFDVLIPGEPFAASSKALLDRQLAAGQLILCEVVFAELAAQFPSQGELRQFLTETGIRVVHSNQESLYIAGARWAAYTAKRHRDRTSCPRCGNEFEVVCPGCGTSIACRFHVLADFIIGAHALTHADCIISRGLGIYKTYFSDLNVVSGV